MAVGLSGWLLGWCLRCFHVWLLPELHAPVRVGWLVCWLVCLFVVSCSLICTCRCELQERGQSGREEEEEEEEGEGEGAEVGTRPGQGSSSRSRAHPPRSLIRGAQKAGRQSKRGGASGRPWGGSR